MENIIMLILGVFISVVGIVNIKGNISTIHSYNRRKVKEEDIPKYGKTVGTGTLIIGISLVLGFIVSFWSEIIIDYIILPAGMAIVVVMCAVVFSMGVPIDLFIAGRVKLKARISSFFIGAGTYLLFAMLLEQQLHVLVIQFCGLNAQSRPWLYYVYAALAAAVFEETGRLIAMKFWMKKWLDFPNALMYGIGHGGVEAILLGGFSGSSNLVAMLMINSGAMQTTLAALPAESANQTVSQLSALWTTPAPLFFVSGIERISAIILHIGLSLLIYRAVKAGKCRTAAFTAVLAYGIHFIVDFFAVAGPTLLPIYVIEIGVFVMAAGTLVMALKMGNDGRTVNSSLQN